MPTPIKAPTRRDYVEYMGLGRGGDLLILCVVLTGMLKRVAIVSQSEDAQMAQTMARRSTAGSLLKILISTG